MRKVEQEAFLKAHGLRLAERWEAVLGGATFEYLSNGAPFFSFKGNLPQMDPPCPDGWARTNSILITRGRAGFYPSYPFEDQHCIELAHPRVGVIACPI